VVVVAERSHQRRTEPGGFVLNHSNGVPPRLALRAVEDLAGVVNPTLCGGHEGPHRQSD
jgi:hypothetical protein